MQQATKQTPAPPEERSLQQEISTSSVNITSPPEALAAANGTLSVTVEIVTNDTIDRIEYSVNGTMVVTAAKEVPYASNIDVSGLSVGSTNTLRAVMVNYCRCDCG